MTDSPLPPPIEPPAATPAAAHAALVTGAGKRLGFAFARALIERGVPTVVHYNRSRGGADELLAFGEARGVLVATVQADLGDRREAAGLYGRAVEALGGRPIDWLINNASIFDDHRALETTLEQWDANHQINQVAPFQLSQALARARLADAGGPYGPKTPPDADDPGALPPGADVVGSIVNILDYRATRPNDDHFPYTMSKAGLASLTVSLAQSWAPRVRVNGVALGNILPAADGSDPARLTFKRTPMKRRGRVDEVVDSVLFMLTGPAYVTGDILYMTGGRHLT